MGLVEKITEGLHKGFVNQNAHASGQFKPKLLANTYQTRETVLSTLLQELKTGAVSKV